MGQNSFTISLFLIACFTVAVLGFVTTFAIDNSPAVDIRDDSDLSSLYTSSSDNITDEYSTAAENTYLSIIKSTVEPGSTTTRTSGSFAITPSKVLPATYNILRVGYSKIFGTDSGFGVFLTAFISILGFLMAMYLIKTFIGGNPD